MTKVMDFSKPPSESGVIFGADCVEIGTGEPMTFAVPTPEQLDASVQPGARVDQAADALVDAIAQHGYSPELDAFAERLCHLEIPPSPEVQLAELDEDIRVLGTAAMDALAFAHRGQYAEAQARLQDALEADGMTFADRTMSGDEAESLSRAIDADRARARAEEQADAEAEAKRYAPEREHLLRGPAAGRPRHPGKP